jgi:hypothetical protein
MACMYPIDAWKSARLNETGKRSITFDLKQGNLDQPLQVPCGKCVGCRADQSRYWAIRMHHEASLHEKNSFLTLTYANPPVSINKRDLQLFFKRLRKHTPLRYFACGEYGEITRRPHYHVVLFGEDFLGGAISINSELYTNPILEAAWGHGMVSVGNLTMASCLYVAGYCNKKLGDPDTFNLMSRRPGIGHSWLDKYRDDIARTGSVVIEGKEYGVPPRYLEWEPEELNELRKQRKQHFINQTPEERWARRTKLRDRELNMKAKLKSTDRETI